MKQKIQNNSIVKYGSIKINKVGLSTIVTPINTVSALPLVRYPYFHRTYADWKVFFIKNKLNNGVLRLFAPLYDDGSTLNDV